MNECLAKEEREVINNKTNKKKALETLKIDVFLIVASYLKIKKKSNPSHSLN